MLSKDQKVKFVKDASKELSKYKVVGIINLSGIPDRLLQKSRNLLKGDVKVILGRKSLLVKILESGKDSKKLIPQMSGTTAIVMSNSDPFELFKAFKSNAIKLAAKPKQIAPDDIVVSGGETTLQPGVAVTELKAAGIDVQIQKGKVVIAKDKVIVKKGEPISMAVSKVLSTLGNMPFKASIEPYILITNGMVFTRDVLDISPERTQLDLTNAFMSAYVLCIERGIINQYTVNTLIIKAYMQARTLGIEAKVYEPGIVEVLLGNASAQAAALGSLQPKETT